MSAARTLPLFPSAPAPEKSHRHKRARPRAAQAPREPPRPEPLPRVAARRLWLAVHLPQLALEVLRDFSASGSAPTAVIDPSSREQVVLACNDKARAAGVRPGQSLNAAIALQPQLRACVREEAREHTRLVQLAAWCQQQFTPLVSLEPPDELLLEVKGSLKLFGSAQALVNRLSARLREQSVTARIALAPTVTASLWLARALSLEQSAGSAAIIEKPDELTRHLAGVPIGCLRWPEEIIALLHGMGLRTVSDLVRLPRVGFARRIGTRWLDELDFALGRRAQVRRGFRAPERFDARRILEHEIETAKKLESACGPLLERLQLFLRKRQAAIAVLALELQHRAYPLTRVRIGLALPSGETAHLHGLLTERLAALNLPAPVIALRMRSGVLLPASPGSSWLWQQAQAAEHIDALPRLIERLRARLGSGQVFGLCALEDHRPEWAWSIRRDSEVPGRYRAHGETRAVERPLWLLTQPRAIRPQGKRLRGPERIETGWWNGRDIARDYFEMRDAEGVRSWVYRERSAPHDWYLHGLFG